MPHVDVNPRISFYYEIHAPHGEEQLDPAAPTVVMLAPMALDVTCLRHITDDPRANDYNFVLFDLRGHGRTRSEPSVEGDYWSQAVEVAQAVDILRLPQFHLVTGQAVAGQVATILVRLFPERVLSIAYGSTINVGEHTLYSDVWRSVHDTWNLTEDKDELLEAMKACGDGIFNQYCPPAYWNDLFQIWKRRYNQSNCLQYYNGFHSVLEETRLTLDDIATITMPVMVVHGGTDHSFPVAFAERFRDGLANSSMIEYNIIQEAPNYLIFTQGPLFCDHLFGFLQRLPEKLRAPRAFVPGLVDTKAALQLVAELERSPEKRELDHTVPESFSRVTPENLEDRRARLVKLRLRALNPVRLDGDDEPETWDRPPVLRPKARRASRTPVRMNGSSHSCEACSSLPGRCGETLD